MESAVGIGQCGCLHVVVGHNNHANELVGIRLVDDDAFYPNLSCLCAFYLWFFNLAV